MQRKRPGDRVRLQHMLDAAQKAITLTAGRRRDDLESDEVLTLALTRLVEIIGEAAFQMTEEGRSRCPSLPWEQIVGMRHRLIHAYFEINYDILWKTVQESLPELVGEITKAQARWG